MAEAEADESEHHRLLLAAAQTLLGGRRVSPRLRKRWRKP